MKRLMLKVVCLGLLLLGSSGCRERIIHNLSETEANRMLTRLHEISIKAEKVRQADGRWSLSVKSRESHRAIKHLSDRRMLRDGASLLKERPSIMSSREDQRFRYERALSREIELTLASLEKVFEARVHLNLPPADPLFGRPLEDSRPGSASVLLVADRDFSLPKEEIASLVSGASGIGPESISILLSRDYAELHNGAISLQLQEATGPIDPQLQKTLLWICSVLLLVGLGILVFMWRLRAANSTTAASRSS